MHANRLPTETVSSAADPLDTINDTLIGDIGDTTIGDVTTLEAAEYAAHLPNRSTPPPRNAMLPSQPSSAPYSKYVSGNVHNHRGRDALHSLLENDIEDSKIIEFDQFLEQVFQFKSLIDANLDTILLNEEMHVHLAKFKSSLKSSEVAHYLPCTSLVNHVFVAIASKKGTQPSIFARSHDKFILRGSSGAVWQPDIVFLSKLDHVQSNLLPWSEVKMVLEFKVKQGLDSTGQLSKSREGSHLARSATRSTASSATSNNSTGRNAHVISWRATACLINRLGRKVMPSRSNYSLHRALLNPSPMDHIAPM